MQHMNEGTLHALLDGELPPEELEEVEQHLAECTNCARRRDEARQFMVGADLLLEGLDAPDQASPIGQPDAVPVGDPQGLILFPFPPENVRQPPRRFSWAPLAWVATIVLAVGAGYLLSRPGEPARSPRSVAQGDAVVSEAERQAPPPQPTAPAAAAVPVDSGGESLAAANVDSGSDSLITDSVDVPPPQELAQAERPRTREPAPPPARAKTTAQPTPRAVERAADTQPEQAVAQAEPSAPPPEPAAAGQLAANAAPPPSSPEANLERRSGIYLRIGLDEARRMLGSPLHVIDGLRPQFIGLVSPGQAPGSDPARPAVRAVYLDASQHLILLDQQRLPIGDSGSDRPHQPTVTNGATGPVAGWVKGNVWLALHGTLSADALGDMARRVR